MRPIDEIEQEIRNLVDTALYDNPYQQQVSHSDLSEMFERLADDYCE